MDYTTALPLETGDTLIWVFSLLPLAICILADHAPGEWRYLYKFIFTLIGTIANIFIGLMYIGPNLMDVNNGAYFVFPWTAVIFFSLAGLYILAAVYNGYEFYQLWFAPEMNTND